ncbi:MAG TPA: hypothetical protein VF627_08640 [Abditibacterium sp.]|jgi:hypothetical protein
MKTLEAQSVLDIISQEMKEAVADAIETHRRMGRSIVVSENGQIKHIKAKDIAPRALPHDEWEKD